MPGKWRSHSHSHLQNPHSCSAAKIENAWGTVMRYNGMFMELFSASDQEESVQVIHPLLLILNQVLARIPRDAMLAADTHYITGIHVHASPEAMILSSVLDMIGMVDRHHGKKSVTKGDDQPVRRTGMASHAELTLDLSSCRTSWCTSFG